jgi:hypothetical protein
MTRNNTGVAGSGLVDSFLRDSSMPCSEECDAPSNGVLSNTPEEMRGNTVHSTPIPESRPASGRMRIFVAVVCVLSLMSRDTLAFAAQDQPAAPAEEAAAPKIPNDQLDALVAPIALYPDPLLSQVLVASTYPLEIIQLQQWLATHKDLKDKALVEAVEKEGCDASIQAMAALPDAVKQLAENIKWTTDLGNAFLAQQNDVMDAVQRMRAKAKGAGNLKSNEQMKVETKVVESKTVVVIEQASPQVVYVPSYNPTVVYGPPVYPYPPIVYPSTGAVVAGMAISFGVGVAMGAAWGGGWGYHSNWGGNNNITINNNNSFVNNSNRQNVNNVSNRQNNVSNRQNTNNRATQGGGNTWQHNPQHRGGAPYSNKATANQFGGTARGDSMQTRQANARQNQGQRGAGRQPSTMNRGSGAGASARPAAGGGGNFGGNRSGGGASNTAANRGGGGGGGDRVGNRQVSKTPSAGNRSALGGGSGGSGSAARSSSQRGASSMGASRGSRGGGGRRR